MGNLISKTTKNTKPKRKFHFTTITLTLISKCIMFNIEHYTQGTLSSSTLGTFLSIKNQFGYKQLFFKKARIATMWYPIFSFSQFLYCVVVSRMIIIRHVFMYLKVCGSQYKAEVIDYINRQVI